MKYFGLTSRLKVCHTHCRLGRRRQREQRQRSTNQRLTRSFCLSGGESEDTGSRTSHFSVTGWTSTADRGSRIFTRTSSFPPVAFRPSITYATHGYISFYVCLGGMCMCVYVSPALTSTISLTSQCFSRPSSFSWAAPTTLSDLKRPLQRKNKTARTDTQQRWLAATGR